MNTSHIFKVVSALHPGSESNLNNEKRFKVPPALCSFKRVASIGGCLTAENAACRSGTEDWLLYFCQGKHGGHISSRLAETNDHDGDARGPEGVRIGSLDVPRGTIIQVARSMLHQNKDAWSPDAAEFRPDRFANGVCRPAHMYMPFGHGPRTCIGQNLAMVELKVVLARLLSRFALVPSPVFRLTIEPGFGMPLLVTRL